MIRSTSVLAAGALAIVAGSASAAYMQLDINGIQVDAGGAFGGTSHTGTLVFTKATSGTFIDILVDGQSTGGATLTQVTGTIELVNGAVVGGSMTILDGDGDGYFAQIGQGGQVNVQAGRGFRIDGLTFSGVFDPGFVQSGLQYGNVDVGDVFGPAAFDETLEGSFLVTSFSPDENGFDGRSDLDVFIVPTPGTAALAGLAGIAVLRRKR
ncbi:MAG: hypothetical protein ACTS27_04310 [Phycisphaerales bacterium]